MDENIKAPAPEQKEPKKKDRKPHYPCVYGVKEPQSVNDLNREYILQYLKSKLKDGEITKEQIAEFMARKKTLEKQSGVRKLFATMFMPRLIKEKVKLDFDGELEKLLNS